jgi:hypothetical protein
MKSLLVGFMKIAASSCTLIHVRWLSYHEVSASNLSLSLSRCFCRGSMEITNRSGNSGSPADRALEGQNYKVEKREVKSQL